jgi:hypothetical protein
MRLFSFRTIWWLFALAVAARGVLASGSSLAIPIVSVDLTSYGYHESEAKQTEAVLGNIGSNVVFISEQIAVIYHTKPDGMNAAATNGTLTAFFVDATTGHLIRKQEWRTVHRRGVFDGKDSEASIFPLSENRYLVMASGTLYLYDGAGSLIVQKILDAGFWSIQPIENGTGLLFRHELKDRSHSFVKYIWADSHTLTPRVEFVDTQEYRSQTAMNGFGTSLAYSKPDGIHGVAADGKDHVLCSDEFCRESAFDREVKSGLVVDSRFGIGVLSLINGMVWLKSIQPAVGLDRVTVSESESSLDGRRLGIMVSRGSKYRTFDGVKLETPSEIFILDSGDGKRVAVLPSGDSAFALSPAGDKAVTFDHKLLRIYQIP